MRLNRAHASGLIMLYKKESLGGWGGGSSQCYCFDPQAHTQERGWVGAKVGIRLNVMFLLKCTRSRGA